MPFIELFLPLFVQLLGLTFMLNKSFRNLYKQDLNS